MFTRRKKTNPQLIWAKQVKELTYASCKCSFLQIFTKMLQPIEPFSRTQLQHFQHWLSITIHFHKEQAKKLSCRYINVSKV